MTSTRRTPPPRSAGAPAEEQALQRDRSALIAPTQDLVQKLTALADRYDALPTPGQPLREQEREVNVTLMRLAAASGSRFIRSAAPSDEEQPERLGSSPADQDEGVRSRDTAAGCRDDAAERRDMRASMRDRRARGDAADLDPGFADRYLSANDRDDAAGDRAAAFDDRTAARRERDLRSDGEAAPEEHADPRLLLEQLSARATFHQAQGLLMARAGLNAAEAFEAVLLEAQQRDTSMTEAAARLVQEMTATSSSQLPSAPRHHDR